MDGLMDAVSLLLALNYNIITILGWYIWPKRQTKTKNRLKIFLILISPAANKKQQILSYCVNCYVGSIVIPIYFSTIFKNRGEIPTT